MKRTLISAAVLSLAVAGTGVASADKPSDKGNDGAGASQGGYKVTGGGQIIADGQQGAGDTVGFNAHRIGEGPDARGQFQFVPRGESTNASAPEEKFHGVVTCLSSGTEAPATEAAEGDGNNAEALMPGSARFGGYLRDDPTKFFTVDVTDNGQGASNTDGDMILVRLTSEPCGDNPEQEGDEAEDMLKLGRGNVKIHNHVDGQSSAADNLRMAAAFAALAR